MKKNERRLIKVGKADVRSALGFFWHDRHKIYVAASPEDIDRHRECGHDGATLRPMEELEAAYRESSPLRFIAWCGLGIISRMGATRVTFTYDDHSVVVRNWRARL